MTYCDSSFLLGLLLPGDFFHPHAARLAARFRESIPFTLLAELEVANTIRRALRELYLPPEACRKSSAGSLMMWIYNSRTPATITSYDPALVQRPMA